MAITASPGITLLVSGKDVPLKLDSQVDGAEFDLVHPVELGTPAKLAVFVTETFGVDDAEKDIDDAIRTLPDVLQGMVDRLMNLEVTVEEFHVKVPATGSLDSTSYTVGLSGTWPDDPITLIPKVLEVKGIYLLIENDGKETNISASGTGTPPVQPHTETAPGGTAGGTPGIAPPPGGTGTGTGTG
jgi:hypothetical protein